MFKKYRRNKQKIFINQLLFKVQNIDWNMQFKDNTRKDFDYLIEQKQKLTMLINIEERVLEGI